MGCVVRFWGLGWWNLRLNGRYVQLLACCESTISSYPSRPFQTRHSKTHAGIIFVGLKEGFSSYFRSKSKMWKMQAFRIFIKFLWFFLAAFVLLQLFSLISEVQNQRKPQRPRVFGQNKSLLSISLPLVFLFFFFFFLFLSSFVIWT